MARDRENWKAGKETFPEHWSRVSAGGDRVIVVFNVTLSPSSETSGARNPATDGKSG